MSSTSSPTHSHGLHVVIPTSESRVPTATTPVTPVKNQGPVFRRLNERSAARSSPTHPHGLFHVLDSSSPTHSHGLFRALDDSSPTHSHGLFRVLDDSSPTHGHGLFVVPNDDSSPTHGHGLFRVPPADSSSPTAPRPSARVMRRSSLFLSNNDHGEEAEHDPEQHQVLSATTEASEPSSAELDGSFEKGAHPAAANTEEA
ncbi:hypothetical protein L226DRAFT_527702 [Lentinus tigrinus ALCF2SS1-7]|uniref:uncharacterized protein n=1 Tax=Lentinus tigrinus ALCF2SS1-7 TaxID=1328758 RepID=UPI001165F169|nr:hypothetical protein L226DRAFT_527702 [Lentinus tigrinus ALCF2SS1-7]